MPGLSVHLHLAQTVLDEWDRQGDAPFDLAGPPARNAFLSGAIAPDMGYYPHGDPFPTDLAHYLSTGDLTRTLARLARSPVETAFAWGWATHVVGDILIHPLVNQATAELRGASRTSLPYEIDPRGHFRVEAGLDAAWHARHGTPKLEPVFDRRGIRYLAAAYSETYGIELSPSALLDSHLAVVRYQRLLLALELAAAGRFGMSVPPGARALSAATAPARWLLRRAWPASWLRAVLDLIPPPGWLHSAVDAIVRAFPARIRDLERSGLAELPNYNLDTGETEAEAAYGLAEAARARLRSERKPKRQPTASDE